MTWVSGVVLYTLIWWVTLFAILPIGARPATDADRSSGWRGTPTRVRFLRTVALTTAVAAVVWGIAYLIIASDYLSFRHGVLAPPR